MAPRAVAFDLSLDRQSYKESRVWGPAVGLGASCSVFI